MEVSHLPGWICNVYFYFCSYILYIDLYTVHRLRPGGFAIIQQRLYV